MSRGWPDSGGGGARRAHPGRCLEQLRRATAKGGIETAGERRFERVGERSARVEAVLGLHSLILKEPYVITTVDVGPAQLGSYFYDMVVSPDGSNIYLIEQKGTPDPSAWGGIAISNYLTQFDVASQTFTHRQNLDVADYYPNGIDISPDGDTVYLLGPTGMYTYDLATKTLTPRAVAAGTVPLLGRFVVGGAAVSSLPPEGPMPYGL